MEKSEMLVDIIEIKPISKENIKIIKGKEKEKNFLVRID